MKTFFISYSYPFNIGSFIVKAENGIEASEKVSSYLKKKGYDLADSNCVVNNINGDKIEFI